MIIKYPSGQILIEILIGIVVLATITILISQISLTSFQGTKVTGGQSVMVALAQEALEAVDAIQSADFHNIYDLTKASQEYYPKVSGGVWTLSTTAGDKTIVQDGISYSRWVTIDNVSRNGSDDIVTSGGTDDPSTQKVTVNVTATGVPTVTYSRYFSRVRNTTALQSDWSGGSGQATNPTSGFDANYNTQYDTGDGNLDLTGTPGSIKLSQ